MNELIQSKTIVNDKESTILKSKKE